MAESNEPELREAEPRDIKAGIERALVSARAVRVQGEKGSICLGGVDGRCLSLVITRLEEAEMWLARGTGA